LPKYVAKRTINVKVDLHVKVSEKSQEKLMFWMTHGKEILMMLLNTHTPKKI
jgi:dsDNA-binding SOS-regulon protein